MSLEQFLKGIEKDSPQLSHEKILALFLEGKDSNIDFKTEINNPFAITTGEVLLKWLKDEFGKECSDLLKSWLKQYKINMVSYKRKSRKEVIEGLKALIEKERMEGVGFFDRLKQKTP